ncbi:hypothetical protein M3079_02540 [Phascolarctobacterium sp. ET69]|uniref:hypothetical protein n=1 Tax=Phascolarctobacterium sp. ET69 TaxID=2939420 RepID=UPI002011A7DA|nr:hypothetical protein [Phascolarctobacterium sp. ET69]MCL1604863.1 hypothetical protein [Phascolarctobacterium sp. ET69]
MPNQELTKKDIALAFKYFRELKRSPKMTESLFATAEEKTAALKAEVLRLAETWYDLYKVVAPEVFHRACKKVVTMTGFWPNEKEMADAIDWAEEQVRRETVEEQRQREEQARADFSAAFTQSQRQRNKAIIAEILAKMTRGEKLNPQFDEDVLAFGRQVFPDASEEWLRFNYVDIANYKREKEFCAKKCQGRRNCPTCGHEPGIQVNKYFGYTRSVYYRDMCQQY